jgi:hypothetical protein
MSRAQTQFSFSMKKKFFPGDAWYQTFPDACDVQAAHRFVIHARNDLIFGSSARRLDQIRQ